MESEPTARAAAAQSTPASVEEALARARGHARATALESIAAVRALLDAAALATRGEASGTHPLLGPWATRLEAFEAQVAQGGAIAASRGVEALAEALDAEIARWEARAREEPEARAVLRAFLGLRELLWELGVRQRGAGAAERRGQAGARGPRPKGSRAPRLQRIPVQE